MMKQFFLLISGLMLVGVVVACSAPPAPTAVPAQPTSAPAATAAPKPTTAPATSAPAATKPPEATKAPAATQPSGSNPPAASGAAQTFEITLTPTDMRPQEITVKVGTKVHFVLTNVDKTEEHNLVSAKAKLKEILVPPKSTVEADWVAPTTAGEFEVPCSIHREIIPLTIHVVP